VGVRARNPVRPALPLSYRFMFNTVSMPFAY
jgi:hypothetical protein